MLCHSRYWRGTKIQKMKSRIKKSVSQTPPNRQVTHTGALHASVGFSGYSLNKIVRRGGATVLVLVFLALTACQEKTQSTQPVKQAIKPVLVVHVNDYSKSTTGISYFDSTNAKELYNAVASYSGVVKHVGIYAESSQQDVLTLTISKPDTITTTQSGNVYLMAKAKAKNDKVLSQYERTANTEIAKYISKISTPATENNTDLAGACRLAAITLEQANFSGYSKYLLITSDLRDCPRKGQLRLQPMPLSNNTIVLLIRPAIGDSTIKRLFPSSPIHVFTSTSDAISFISHNQNQ